MGLDELRKNVQSVLVCVSDVKYLNSHF